MIAVDSCVWIDYLQGKSNRTVALLEGVLEQGTLVLPPVVFVEVLSFPKLEREDSKLIQLLPRIELTDGYWQRCSDLRNSVLKKGMRCRLGDTLIAQSCIDSRTPLITSDRDFKSFLGAGLQLL